MKVLTFFLTTADITQVESCTKGWVRTRQDDCLHIGIGIRFAQNCGQGGRQCRVESVAGLRAIESDDGNFAGGS